MIVVNNIVWKQEEMINLWTQHRKQIKVISEENLWTQCEWNCHHWEKTYINFPQSENNYTSFLV